MYGPWDKYYSGALERLQAREGVVIIGYVQYLKSRGVGLRRLFKVVSTLNGWSKFLFKKFEEATEQDIEDARARLLESSFAEWTRHDFLVILGGFYRWKGKKNPKYRLDADLFKYKMNLRLAPPNNNPPEDEDVKAMLGKVSHVRDKFLLLVLYYTGMRVGELFSLRIKDLEYIKKDNAYKIHIRQGKTGPRSIMAFSELDGVIKEYLFWHPHKDEPEYPLIVRIAPHKKIGEPANYSTVNKALRTLGAHAGLIRKINPHRFRHACNRNFERRGWTEIQRCKYLGWTPGSTMPKVYSHLAVEETDKLVLAARSGNEEELVRKKEAVKEWIRDNPEFEELLLQKVKSEIARVRGKKQVLK